MTDQILDLHKEAMAELSDLQKRMDDDQDFPRNVQYIMQDAKGKKIDGVVNITINRPLVFRTYVEAALGKSDEKVLVNSDDEKLNTANIEKIITAIYAQGNAKRGKNGNWKIESVIDQMTCERGSAAMLIVCTKKNDPKTGEYLDIDIVDWDTRYSCFIEGSDGYKQAGIDTEKTKAQIESAAWAVEKGFQISGKSGIQTEIWTLDKHLFYIDDKEEFGEDNPFGFVPIAFRRVPIGTMLSDKDRLKYEGESIFYPIRSIVKEINRIYSIISTKAIESIKGPIQVKTDKDLGPNFYREATAPGAATSVDETDAIRPIQFNDIKQSALHQLGLLENQLDDATLSRVMRGTLPTGGISAVALLEIERGQGQVLEPRLATRGLLKTSGAEMAIAEILTLNLNSFDIGTKGHKKSWNKKDIEGEYEIQYIYSNKTTETDYARLSIAKGYKDVLDDLTVLRDVLHRDDPEGDLAKLHRQQLRELVPPLRIYDGVMALSKLYEDGDESVAPEIDIAEAYLGVAVEQLKSGQFPQLGESKRPEDKTDLPIVSDLSSNQKAADLKRSPADMEAG
ncbi:MAG: hypothetical protein WC329_01940 [Candidatus Omnitrophota bacterium]|jgi:hypothetical protein